MTAALLAGLLATGCQTAGRPSRPDAAPEAAQPAISAPARYAGEVLGHMMAVVTGTAGAVQNRPQWRSRGIDLPLDFDWIQRAMADPAFDKSRILVYDSEIIGLSRVLYHYDARLNGFKGRRPFYSPFPSDELIALRLLLIGKMHRGETIRFNALLDRLPVIVAGGDLAPEDAAATGMRREEARLLGDVFRSEPALTAYLRHPAVIDALWRTGILAGRPLSKPGYPGVKLAFRGPRTVAAVSVLPSFETAFRQVREGGKDVLAATTEYRRLVEALKSDIVDDGGQKIIRDLRARHPELKEPQNGRWESAWRRFVERRVVFFTPFTDPLAITPYNAGERIREVCPAADLNVILTGREVLRSMDVRPERDAYPNSDRIFLDADDVRYGLVQEPVSMIGRWLADRAQAAFYRELTGP